MKLHRRNFLKASAATSAAPALGGFAPVATAATTASVTAGLVASSGSNRLIIGERDLEMPVWGYGGTSPGQTLTVGQGDVLDIRLKIELPEDRSIR